jgi:LPXTG-site transpeptidase (sortase) family protein
MSKLSPLLALLTLLVIGTSGPQLALAAPRESSLASATTPSRLVIPAIGLSQPLVAVGVDRRNMPIVPKHNVGWYLGSARPGQGDNVVLWGHVLRWKDSPGVPAPFERLKYLRLGDTISVVSANGRVYRYRVSRKVLARSNEVGYILPTGAERLTLVSCYGDNVIVRGELTKTHRLITIATPVR